ncbi:MAG: hypothetical protein WCB99_04170 [Candidatus Cybelea sp.]
MNSRQAGQGRNSIGDRAGPDGGVKLVTIGFLKKRWSISNAHSYRIASEQLHAVKIGAALRIPLANILAFEQAHGVPQE